MNSGLNLIWSELLNIVNNRNSHTNELYNNTHQRRSSADSQDSEDSCEMYIMRVLTKPLSLKQHARIVIRNRIIENMKEYQFVRNYVLSNPQYQLPSALESNSRNLSVTNATATSIPNRRHNQTTSSILECLIWQLDLPRILHFYLYAFPDVPPMPEDIAVFVND